MINTYYASQFCHDDISLIENYAEAVSDPTQTWDCHHRIEILPYAKFSRQQLKDFGLYYNRPACELIFIPHPEHMKLHNSGKKLSAQTRKRMSASKRNSHWYTDGIMNKFTSERPEGFVPGITKHN